MWYVNLRIPSLSLLWSNSHQSRILADCRLFHNSGMKKLPLPDEQPIAVNALRRMRAVAHYKLLIAKLRRAQYGQSSARGRRLLDQLELQLEELAASAAEDEAKAAPVDDTAVRPFTRRKPVRAPFRAYGAPAARAGGDPGADRLPALRRQARQALTNADPQLRITSPVRRSTAEETGSQQRQRRVDNQTTTVTTGNPTALLKKWRAREESNP
jgi:hypothetical protein